jgi:uncharacterized membrane protein HdeD (DUF308 family)/predicted flap endonuclease-1-like 5' DNA nuclease
MTAATATNQESSTLPWWVVLLEGIAAIIIGLLLLTSPGMTTIVLVQLLGIYWLIAGIFQIVAIFVDSSMWGWKLFSGVLGIIAGIIILRHPLWSALLVPATLVILLGLLGITIGIIKLIQAFQGEGWGVGILGALSIILGIILMGNVLIASLTLPPVLGIFAIIGGVLALVGAFRLKGGQAELPAAETAEPVPLETTERVVTLADAGEEAIESVAEEAQDAGVATPEVAPTSVEEAPSEELPGEEAPPVVGVELSQVPEAVEKVLETLPPEVLTKLKDSPEYVEGIGPVYSQTLKGIGIHTLLDLLKHGAMPKGRAEIADKSGISHKLILKWVNHIDLYRVKGVGSEYADLLEAAGVDTVVELATRNPGNLFEKLSAVNEEKNLVRRPPASSQVEEWVEQAKQLPRVINY